MPGLTINSATFRPHSAAGRHWHVRKRKPQKQAAEDSRLTTIRQVTYERGGDARVQWRRPAVGAARSRRPPTCPGTMLQRAAATGPAASPAPSPASMVCARSCQSRLHLVVPHVTPALATPHSYVRLRPPIPGCREPRPWPGTRCSLLRSRACGGLPDAPYRCRYRLPDRHHGNGMGRDRHPPRRRRRQLPRRRGHPPRPRAVGRRTRLAPLQRHSPPGHTKWFARGPRLESERPWGG